MIKICPKCKKPKPNERLLECPNCNCAFVDENEIVGSFTKEELRALASELRTEQLVFIAEQVSKRPLTNNELKTMASGLRPDQLGVIAFKMSKSPVFLLISLCAAILLLFCIYKLLSSQIDTRIVALKTTLTNQLEFVYKQTTNDLTSQFGQFVKVAENNITTASNLVQKTITDEFRAERITQTVANVASNQAMTILEGDVRPSVDRFRADADFLRTTARAQAYDFASYLRLVNISTTTNDNASDAERVVLQINRTLDAQRSAVQRKYEEFFGTNLYTGPFTSDELAMRFQDVQLEKYNLNREGFANTARECHQPLFLGAFIQLFTNETDLVVADCLASAISDLTKEDFRPRDIASIELWWIEHQRDCTNYPIIELKKAITNFDALQYQQASDGLEHVLQLDSAADLSRYLLIATYLDLGLTNKALPLAKTFHDGSSRYALLASAKIELETGSVTNASVQLAKLWRGYPAWIVVSSSPLPYYTYTWRNINRELFDKTFASPKP